ncbi:trans-sulfuration enzyme family protein [Marinobacter salexigens]|uniref:trans-sulfuration enzyme family protein n=1 Tax=Marinobacter salexigens TaxID=1925763 RepID=UPI000C282199|nr:aminotransferase class I/II-fold pyridoxal phosphate-dependent enzyme [Marinobacter salexigens]
MRTDSEPGKATRIIHNRRHKDSFGSPYSPIYNTTTYRFQDTASLRKVIGGNTPGNLYTRWGSNPSIQELEQGLAGLENAEDALAFASGMAAISASLFAHGRNGIVCVGDLYGGTQELLTQHLRPLGIPVTFLLKHEPDLLARALNKPGMLVYCESPANPTLSVLDIRQLAQQAHGKNALLAVDNTFASPVNQQPLALGADLSLHSASMFLGGHSDITAGAVMGSTERVKPIALWRKNLGQILAPETAALLSRSLRTLPLRVKQHNDNAMAVAQAMEGHAAIKRVLYPGLPDFPGHNLARQQMDGFGGVLTLEIDGGREQAVKVADNLQVFLLATSLGGVESLVSQPCATSHHGISQEERERRGITDSMLRLSVGLEDAQDLIADLEQALDQL